jgi:hypothetical protein
MIQMTQIMCQCAELKDTMSTAMDPYKVLMRQMNHIVQARSLAKKNAKLLQNQARKSKFQKQVTKPIYHQLIKSSG